MALASVASAFVADIGGTNLRMALCAADGTCAEPVILHCADYCDLTLALRTALGQIGETPALRRGALAVVGPVTGDRVRFTNLDWTFSTEELRRELGLERLIVVNDTAASVLALPHLAHDEAIQFGGGAPDPAAAMVMLAPGTGLGVAGLVPSTAGWIPVPSEGGHAGFAPADDREIEILQWYRKRYDHVSCERILSGAGLVDLYHAVAEIDGLRPRASGQELAPADIAHWASDRSCPAAVATAVAFSRILGGTAGNLALSFAALGGVYVDGGVALGLGDALDRRAFRDRFESKRRFRGYLSRVPSFLVSAPNPTLIGLTSVIVDADAKGAPARRRRTGEARR